MKKFLSILLVLVMLGAIAGCGAKETETQPETTGTETETTETETTETETTEPQKLTIWAWDPNFNIAIMNRAGEIYKESNTEVEFEVVDFAKGDLEQKLHTMLASGTTDGLPDIVLIEDYNSQKYLQSYPGSFEDLTGKINHSDFAEYKVALMTMDNSVYGVPFDSGVAGTYYRTDYLAEAGFSPEDMNNITWDRFIEIGEEVFEKTGHQMMATDPYDGGLMRIMLNGAGSWYFDNDGNPTIANNVALAEAARIYTKIVNSPMTKKTSGWGEWVGALNTGDVASITTGVWITGSVKAEASQSGLWALAPVPKLDVPGAVNASNLGGSSWYVLSSSANKDLAVDFLNETFGKDVDFYQEILISNGAVGSYLPSASGEAYSAGDEFFGNQVVFGEFAKWMDEIPSLNYGLYTYEADAAILAEMASIYEGGSVEEAMARAEEQVKSQIQ
ncbi:MAG: ABC transporter substrate-binding protein [Firmicutes bacterium HGW-Firmicutes-3]|jgi:lactose/L-arabinose transport system substrate-binding protein|nr:MAG: ABC transporter substrate-binding protein [Firmicutes bacterium HGW-Firmicutes-3]